MAASKGALETTCILALCFQTGNIIGDGWWVDNVETLMECSVDMLVMKALIYCVRTLYEVTVKEMSALCQKRTLMRTVCGNQRGVGQLDKCTDPV